MPMMTDVNGRDVSKSGSLQKREVFSDIQDVKKDPSPVLIVAEITEKFVLRNLNYPLSR
jgi:hypothetical protein